MQTETITAKVNKQDIEKIKTIIESFKEKFPKMVITPLRYGKIGDEIVVNFKIEEKFAKIMLEKLVMNKIILLSQSQKTQKVIENIKQDISRSAPVKSGGWSDVRNTNKFSSKPKVDELTSNGNYSDLIKISRTIIYGKNIADAAKENIDPAIENAINQAYSEGLSKKFESDKNIQKLFQIASDNNLKLLQKNDYMKEAGLKAIELATSNKSSANELITIANNTAVHNFVSIKAVVNFASLIFKNPEEYKEDIEIAIRKLNIRWLKLNVASVEKDFSFEDIKLLEDLFEFIQNKRTEKNDL